MGRLLAYPKDFASSRSDTKPGLDPEWYFTEENGSHGHTAWEVSSTFPFSASIHNDVINARGVWPRDKQLEESRKLKVEVRTFIEFEIVNTVIWTAHSKTYHYVWPPKDAREKAVITDVNHGYHVFHFVTKAEPLLFKLRFAEQVTDETEWHPHYHPDGDSFTAKSQWEARDEIQKRWGYGAVPSLQW